MAKFLTSNTCFHTVLRSMATRINRAKISPAVSVSQPNAPAAPITKPVDKMKVDICSMSSETAREVSTGTASCPPIRYRVCQDCSTVSKASINLEDQKVAEELRSLQPALQPEFYYNRSELWKP